MRYLQHTGLLSATKLFTSIKTSGIHVTILDQKATQLFLTYKTMNRYLGLFISTLILPMVTIPVEARQYYKDTRNIQVTVSQSTGHLLDWSMTNRRIKAIQIDNPELFTKNFIFTIDGCNPKKCTNASIILISARPTAERGKRGTLRVIAVDARGGLHPYTIAIQVTRGTPNDNETRFEPDTQFSHF
jgi:hypothetical protein